MINISLTFSSKFSTVRQTIEIGANMSESITISVTIPKQLNEFIVNRSKNQGISRSRYISTELLVHQNKVLQDGGVNAKEEVEK